MKKLLAVFLTLALLLSFAACEPQYGTDVTREEIIAAYKASGYSVSSQIYGEKLEHGVIGYIRADHPDGEYIYFSIFETEADAQAYKDEFYHPAAKGLLSVIFGDPSWQRWEVYGCIVAQYGDPGYMEPFKELLEGK